MTKSPFIALRSLNFSLYWFGFFTSQLAIQMYIVAINWHLYTLAKSPAMLGILGIVSFVPILLFAMLGGIIADKINRKKTLVLVQLLRSMVSIVLLYQTFYWQVSPFFLYMVTGMNALLTAFDLPARQSLLPHVVDKKHFVNAVSLTTVAREASVIFGPSMAGVLIDIWHIEGAYVVAAIATVISTVVLLPMRSTHQFKEEKIAINFAAIKEGISFVSSSPLIWGGMFLDFIVTFFSSATVLLPIFIKEILGSGVSSLGLLYAAPSIGAVLSGVIFSSFSNVKNQGKILIFSVLLYGVATIGFGLSTSIMLSFIFLFLTGVGDMISTIIRNTIRQLITPDYLRGRMVAINMIFFIGGPQLGNAEAGFLAAAIGVPFSVALGGVGAIIGTLLLVAKIPKLWSYKQSA